MNYMNEVLDRSLKELQGKPVQPLEVTRTLLHHMNVPRHDRVLVSDVLHALQSNMGMPVSQRTDGVLVVGLNRCQLDDVYGLIAHTLPKRRILSRHAPSGWIRMEDHFSVVPETGSLGFWTVQDFIHMGHGFLAESRFLQTMQVHVYGVGLVKVFCTHEAMRECFGGLFEQWERYEK